MLQRCDNRFDCDDATDEDGCPSIEVPPKIGKSFLFLLLKYESVR